MSPGDTDWQPGQCLFTRKPDWIAEELPANDGAFWAPALETVGVGNFSSEIMYYSVQSMEEDAQCIGLAFATGTVPNQKVEGHFNPNPSSSCQNLNSYINLHKTISYPQRQRISNLTFTNFHEHLNQSDCYKKNEIRNKQSRVILKVKRFVNSLKLLSDVVNILQRNCIFFFKPSSDYLVLFKKLEKFRFGMSFDRPKVGRFGRAYYMFL